MVEADTLAVLPLVVDVDVYKRQTDYYLQGTENKVSWDEVGIKRNGDYMLGLELDAPVTAADIKSHFNYCLLYTSRCV